MCRQDEANFWQRVYAIAWRNQNNSNTCCVQNVRFLFLFLKPFSMNCDTRNIFVVVFSWRLHFPMSFSVWSWKLTIGLTTKHKDWNVYVFIISSRGNTQINISFLCLLYLLILLSLWLRWVNKFCSNQRLKRNSASSPVRCVVWRQTHTHFTLAHSLQHWQRAGVSGGSFTFIFRYPKFKVKNQAAVTGDWCTPCPRSSLLI